MPKTLLIINDTELSSLLCIKKYYFYHGDIMEKFDDVTIYVNDVEYATVSKDENYTLSLS